MSNLLKDSMSEATRLMNEGRLAEATAAIQRALGGISTPVVPEDTGETEGPVETAGPGEPFGRPFGRPGKPSGRLGKPSGRPGKTSGRLLGRPSSRPGKLFVRPLGRLGSPSGRRGTPR